MIYIMVSILIIVLVLFVQTLIGDIIWRSNVGKPIPYLSEGRKEGDGTRIHLNANLVGAQQIKEIKLKAKFAIVDIR